MNKITKIPDIYDKIGTVLIGMRAERGTAKTFTSGEVYLVYSQRFPEDEEFMKNLGGESLKEYVPGMVWEYSRKFYGIDSNRPPIQFLGKKTYRFV